jgi:3-dehydroquinate synthase
MKTKERIIQTKSYPIIISDNIGTEIDQFLFNRDYSSLFILMDENIMDKCWPKLYKESELLREAEIFLIEPGEQQKNIEIVVQLWQALSEYEADRSSLLINFGGGVISDMGGFIASTYKRGIDFINIPTSLLSMVDASVGGKTGINLDYAKNQIGVFNQPQALFIQFDFLKTLDERQIKNGFAEMLKHGLIANTPHWKSLSNLAEINQASLSPFIEDSIRIKNEMVELDPLEKGIRKSLNFGHTIGHLLETWSLQNDENPLLHGEAITIGLLIESYLSINALGLSDLEFQEIKDFITKTYKKYSIPDSLINEFETIINQDKKKKGKKLNFTFVPQIGSFKIDQNCSMEEIKESLIYYKENC